MSYTAPVAEMRFLIDEVLGGARLAETARFAEATPETVEAILTGAARLAEEVMAPLRRAGDLEPARLENGVVRTTPGFAEAYRAIAEGGWVGLTADPQYGGMGLPMILLTCVNEMMAGANLALSLAPLLTHGAIEALQAHGDEALKALCLPKLASGEWTGTMNLTEPQAGSDVGALRTRAEPNGDGSFAVTGQKIYITWGDHDVAENICHMVLARLPDAAPGTKGISLFMVPKYLPDEAGRPGRANSLRAVSLEHKMGLHGSPTCVMAYEGATGWLVGGPHQGMAAMFTMMNNARLGVGVEGLAQADAALQEALAYARERRQGRPTLGGETILGHADVRRMLATMAALTATARAICLDCALSTDLGVATGEAGWKARAAFLTPIAKAFGTDTGCEVRHARHAGLRRHGIHRGDRRGAVLPRRAGHCDLRGHQRHPGNGHGRAQARGRWRGSGSADRGDRGDGEGGGWRGRRAAGASGGAAGRGDGLDGGGRGRGSCRWRGRLPAGLRAGPGRALSVALGGGRGRRRATGGAGGVPRPPDAAAGRGALRRRLRRRSAAPCTRLDTIVGWKI